ncbi:MAG: hypothetical protein A3B23_02530 [Candidatus Colwellbacteria bacterium RIFCSPLOWO2_01_FULL_48_10]|uniref:UDP-N-acetylmuramoyl-L-alanyl-D-glutamate--2, 6-diaminopimelate ligase n=1 Tax=Candidatus Colwellbacteria bacterium RIFCSPLOWO2_01_FULL_48_10 TaxID=1797690 RepID=A0A1G1Z688_9BACT|nr:MAG: hypothetical protein A3B23_02530 [Candidatus Colwellbacteria bacterium RIFCSPLOWO2_01_FULL_48_10]
MRRELLSPYHFALSLLGAILYRHPSRKIAVIGVTGTKGKTTVVELINAGLEEAGKRTAMLSSIRRKVGDESGPNSGNSMPGRFAIQKFLSDAVKAKCNYALIEVTSEGVVQHRHRNIEYDAGVFINLHPEHIESHGSFEKYRKAKMDFFGYIGKHSRKSQRYFFINQDDEHARFFAEAAKNGRKIMFGKSALKSNMAGEFNKWNLGAAEAVLKTLGVSVPVIENAFTKFAGVPGRMEYVLRKPFEVVVDYAHTPESLEQVYQSLKSQIPNPKPQTNQKSEIENSNLICVLGSASGGRDKWKRPKLGEIASRYCREIILTDEDPYDENPSQILADIEFGIPNVKIPITNVHKILNRKEAIKKAISLAKSGDTVIITGKGSEKSIHVARGKKIPWSDKATVMEILAGKDL